MKKQIVRMMAAILIMAAFAGVLSACASESAIEMQDMIDKLVAEYYIPKAGTAPAVEAYQTAKYEEFDARIEAIDKFYDDLSPAEKNAPGMSRAVSNLNKLKKLTKDYRFVTRLILEVETMQIVLEMQAGPTYKPGDPLPPIDKNNLNMVYGWIDDYDSLTSEQKQLHEPEALAKVYAQLMKWKAELGA